jgi:hypothetical protein
MAVGILGDEARMKDEERALLGTGLSNMLATVQPETVQRLATWYYPATLALGSFMYAARLTSIAVVKRREAALSQPAAAPAETSNGSQPPPPPPAPKVERSAWNPQETLGNQASRSI